MKRLTMRDVAAMAGVSAATVSRVVSDSPLVSDDTRRKVLRTIQKLNYQPNNAARTLKSRRSDTIGLLVPDIANPYFAELARGVEDSAHKQDYSLVLCNYDNNAEKEKRYLQVLMQKQVDGLICAGSGLIRGAIANSLQSGVPVVLLDSDIDGLLNVDAVTIDDSAAAELAVEHLLRLGHTRVAVLMGPPQLPGSTRRLKGYKRALARYHLPFDEALVVSGQFTADGGYSTVQQLLFRQASFTAVFAMCDMMAIGGIQALEEAGVTIPDDVAVMGLDGIPLGKLMKPAVSTVAQPIYELGSRAFGLLHSGLRNKEHQPQQLVLQTKLVIRESCGYHHRHRSNSSP